MPGFLTVVLHGQPLHVGPCVSPARAQRNNVIHLPARAGAAAQACGGAWVVPYESSALSHAARCGLAGEGKEHKNQDDDGESSERHGAELGGAAQSTYP